MADTGVPEHGRIGDVARFCSRCDYFKVFRSGRCKGCDKWFREMGYERPWDRIQLAITRALHKEMNWERALLAKYEQEILARHSKGA